ncbi:hypothetical protein [Marinitoga sp. 38H-ov]|uniref:hypothetical protein n=1 Tax=Marinitoga sp. 38H-ov TaxID=1755814 RepID=UPI0013EBF9C9|nr:hypothetical protein [Marinitoga sp. 38H-ov]KAF2955513.1 hypothetical protein AS160_09960 [Marinitoga sp. 38H-ov]
MRKLFLFIFIILLFFSCSRFNKEYYNFNVEGITRIPNPDEKGDVFPHIALMFDVYTNNFNSKYIKIKIESTPFSSITENSTVIDYINKTIISEFSIQNNSDKQYHQELRYFIYNINDFQNKKYLLEIYDKNDNLLNYEIFYLGEFYPKDTFSITYPKNNYTFSKGENIKLKWSLSNFFEFLNYDRAEINLFRYNEEYKDFDWENRIRIADNYDSFTSNFNIYDEQYDIPYRFFNLTGKYLIELTIYNSKENTSFEYHVVINII